MTQEVCHAVLDLTVFMIPCTSPCCAAMQLWVCLLLTRHCCACLLWCGCLLLLQCEFSGMILSQSVRFCRGSTTASHAQ